ncbi:hypothetical protein K9M50_02295 [Patescibacteria group bacterium]|nr:hypothetical protein [Patescibacteria group bacterium]
MKNSFRIKIRVFLVMAWILALAFFIIRLIVPSGVITYTSDFSKETGFIHDITPHERINDEGDKVKIIADPAYFSLYYPRQFQKAQIRLKYKWENVQDQVLEMGVLADKDLWQYHLEPLENTILEKAINSWHLSRSNNLIFLQKNKKFNSLNDFLQSDFSRSSTAVYNINSQDLKISEFKLTKAELEKIEGHTIEQDLIGHHQFYMYHPGEDLSVDIRVQDLNQNNKEDNIEIFLFYQDQVIAKESLNSIVSLESSQVSKPRNLSLKLSDLSEGLYKIQIKVSDDIIIKQINTNSNRLAFINNVYLGESDNDIKLYTDNTNLKVVTTKADSLQTISYAGASFELASTYKQHNFQTNVNENNLWQEINLKKGNLKLSTNSMFSFNKEFAFNPEMIDLDDSVNLDNIDYIIANYEPVEKEGDWHIASANFDLSHTYSEDNKYSFMFSLPNFSYKRNTALVIDSIEVTLEGKNIWQKIKEIIK